jgi:drug/metabolite transporter (DMT)-like permease
VAVLLALASAALYGAADFLGGLASRTISTIATVVISQAAGLMLLLVILPALPANPGRDDMLWGAAAGVAGGLGVALLYRALAVGTMGIVAPTTAVCAVLIPVSAEVLAGERVPNQAFAGMALALVAIIMVSQSRSGKPEKGRTVALPLAVVSGVAIGLFFLALARTAPEAGLWPLVTARGVSVTLFLAVALATRASLRIPNRPLATVVACGVLDMGANALYVLATQRGILSIVVTLASLYPASTVVLARVVLGEKLTGLQAAGIVSALVAVVLIVSA